MIKQRAGIDMVHVPYRSGPQVLTDVAGGQVDLAVLPVTLAQPFIKDGKVKAYGVTSQERSPSAPTMPAWPRRPSSRASTSIRGWACSHRPARRPRVIAALGRARSMPRSRIRRSPQARDIAVKPQLIAGPAFAAYLAKERKAIARRGAGRRHQGRVT